jgi:hypothetical protein
MINFYVSVSSVCTEGGIPLQISRSGRELLAMPVSEHLLQAKSLIYCHGFLNQQFFAENL